MWMPLMVCAPTLANDLQCGSFYLERDQHQLLCVCLCMAAGYLFLMYGMMWKPKLRRTPVRTKELAVANMPVVALMD